MATISNLVKINVETFYQIEYSNPLTSEYMFAYRIKITNLNSFPIKIMRRRWEIFDSKADMRVIEGEGVVGLQPTIQSDETYEYVSGCNLKSEMGSMTGEYTMLDLDSNTEFKVLIPVFEMIAPYKYN